MQTPMGYEFQTTFWQDFTIADMFGIASIKDTYNRAFKEWKDNYEYLTELILVLNWKCWQHNINNRSYSDLYEDYYGQAYDYALDNFNDEQKAYMFRVLD